MKPGADDRARAQARTIADLRRRLDRVPARWGGSPAVPIPWLRIDGGRTLNASPLITGVDVAASASPSNAGALNPGTVDPTTGLETVAASGSYDQGFGYGTLRLDGGAASRVIVIHPSGGVYRFSLLAGTVWVARSTTATIDGEAGVVCYQVVAP